MESLKDIPELSDLKELPELTAKAAILYQHVKYLTLKVSDIFTEMATIKHRASLEIDLSNASIRSMNRDISALNLELQEGLQRVNLQQKHLTDQQRQLSDQQRQLAAQNASLMEEQRQLTIQSMQDNGVHSPPPCQPNVSNMENSLIYTESLQQQKHENDLEQAATQFRKSIIHMWKDRLNKRKTAFWDYLKNEKQADIYYDWSENKPVILPEKLIPKLPEGESQQEHQSRINESLSKFKALHERMIHKSRDYYHKMEGYDQEMLAYFAKHCNNDKPLTSKLSKMWFNECEAQEKVSQERWKNKAAWFSQYKTDFLYGVIREENKPDPSPKSVDKTNTASKTQNAKNTKPQGDRHTKPSVMPGDNKQHGYNSNHSNNRVNRSEDMAPTDKQQNKQGNALNRPNRNTGHGQPNHVSHTNSRTNTNHWSKDTIGSNARNNPGPHEGGQKRLHTYDNHPNSQAGRSGPHNGARKPHPSANGRTNQHARPNHGHPTQAQNTARPLRYADALRSNNTPNQSVNPSVNPSGNQSGPFLGQWKHVQKQTHKRKAYQNHIRQ